ncbi:XTP/dITP diphosphatase [Alteromonas facilis]|uniref:XTP/dITP diphosphatase n=1 Tax=Alteromonas facilis TaxID=2048004 RepID=UPI000C2859CE|nr:XTP/dITP diphosphatase [Alteromonas facilis]
MNDKQIVLASGNKGKVAEFNHLLSEFAITVSPQSDFNVESVPETGTTFVENAIIKARHAAAVTGLPAIADDSGLVVSALNGAPGIYSSRYAGENANDSGNIDKLLSDMQESEDRNAHFYCCLVFLRHANDPVPMIAEGRWFGTITHQRQGDNGFGYDPVFYVPELSKTAAQMPKDEKGRISHRAKALALLMPQLKDYFA